jgi:hypothetical protein
VRGLSWSVPLYFFSLLFHFTPRSPIYLNFSFPFRELTPIHRGVWHLSKLCAQVGL